MTVFSGSISRQYSLLLSPRFSNKLIAPLLILFLSACGSDGESSPPMDPGEPGPVGDGLTPDLPQHNNLGDIVVMPEPVVTIRPISGVFAPSIFQSKSATVRYNGGWVETARYTNPFSGEVTGALHPETVVNRTINQSNATAGVRNFALPWKVNGICDAQRRPLLYQSGTLTSDTLTCETEASYNEISSCGPDFFGNYSCTAKLDIDWEIEWPQLTNPPYIKRTATWQAVPIDGSVTEVVSTGATTQTFTSEITIGSSETSVTSFAETITVSGTAGVDIKFIQAAGTIEKEVGDSFSNSITISEEVTLTEEITYPPGGVFRRWGLEETYEFVNEDGSPFADPAYEFVDFATFSVKGARDFIVDQTGSNI